MKEICLRNIFYAKLYCQYLPQLTKEFPIVATPVRFDNPEPVEGPANHERVSKTNRVSKAN